MQLILCRRSLADARLSSGWRYPAQSTRPCVSHEHVMGRDPITWERGATRDSQFAVTSSSRHIYTFKRQRLMTLTSFCHKDNSADTEWSCRSGASYRRKAVDSKRTANEVVGHVLLLRESSRKSPIAGSFFTVPSSPFLNQFTRCL